MGTVDTGFEETRQVTRGKGEQKERTENTWKDKENGGVELLKG